MGTAKYTLDSELPDMLYAVLVKSPYLDATIKSVDSNEATKSAGVVKIVREGNLLAVVAKSFYAADSAAKKVLVEWNTPNKTQQVDLIKLVTVGNGNEANIQKEGSAKSILKDNKTEVFRQEYRTPMAAHAQMEVNGAIAHVEANKVLIITGSQGPSQVRDVVAKAIDIKKDNIDRIDNFEKVDILYNILNRIGQVKRQKPIMRQLIANYFYLLNIKDFKIIDEYLTLKKLNLKNKKYSFGKNCIKEKNIFKNLKLFNDFIDDCIKTDTVMIYTLQCLLN
jgi:hypothetical protein